MWRRGNGSRGAVRDIRSFRSVPYPVSSGAAVPLAAVIPSRAPALGRGRMGRVRVRGSGQAGSIKRTPALPGDGGGADNSAISRPAAGQGKLFMAPAGAGSPAVSLRESGTGSGSARRAGRRTPG